MYERAAGDDKPNSLLHVGGQYTFWTGAAGYLASHHGGAPVFLAGLHGKFRLRLPGEPWAVCRAAILPPGVSHELDFAGEPFAALYIEPNLGGLDVLVPLLRQAEEAGGAFIGTSDEIPLLRSFHEDLSSERWAEEALSDLLMFAGRNAGTGALDSRLVTIIDFLHEHFDDLTPIEDLARGIGLSSSRFQHLFTQKAGIPFRRYRAWNRLRMAWREIAKGATVTVAAQASGFFDSAHFAHEYRRTFGKACFSRHRPIVRTTGP